ncbi:MAG: putative S-layer protein [Nanoarchaeota archaeon]
MKSTLYTLSVFAMLLLALGLVSASLTVSPSNINLQRGSDNSTFSVTNTINSSVNVLFSQLSITDEKSNVILFNVNGNNTLSALGTNSFALLPATPIDYSTSNFNLAKTYPGQFTVSDSLNPNVNQTISVVLKSDYCKAGNKGDLSLDINYNNKGIWGKDDEWYPLEEIEVVVDVDNIGDEDLQDVVLDWGLYNKRTGKFIVDDNEKSVDIDSDDTEIFTFTFQVDPNDLNDKDSESDFVFFIKAYSKDSGENVQCQSQKDDVKIVKDKHFVVLDNIQVPETAQCGQNVDLTADIWNIGDNDEDDVYVTLVSTELGVNKRVDVGSLNVLDNSDLTFNFQIPSDKKDGSYRLALSVFDDNDDVFQNDNDDEARFNQLLTVSGCTPTNRVSITALLDSDAIAGEEMVVKVTLTNTGSAKADYKVSANGYDSWATLKSISPDSLSLDAGRNGDVFIKLTPNDDVSGSKEFTIQVVSNGVVNTQEISVPIEAVSTDTSEDGKTSGITGLSISKLFGESGNWFIWVIALINVVLIVLIIVVAVKLARR